MTTLFLKVFLDAQISKPKEGHQTLCHYGKRVFFLADGPMSREDGDLDWAGVQAWILLSMQLGMMPSEGLPLHPLCLGAEGPLASTAPQEQTRLLEELLRKMLQASIDRPAG